MKNIFLILPNQLFKKENSNFKNVDEIHIIEEPFYFLNYSFHRQKLILHRASMKYYYDYLNKKYRNKVYYIEYDKINYEIYKNNNLFMYDPIDKPVFKKYDNNNLTIYDTPLFLETLKDLEEYRNNFTNKKNYYHDNFYKWQRKRLNILIENNKPKGGKWSYDKYNRNKYDKDYKEDKIITYDNKYIKEAINYIEKNKDFNKNFGDIDYIYYPVTHKEAKNQLKIFIKNKLKTFGKYQDGISKNIIFGSHSALSPLLNIGLITPEEVIKEVLKYEDKYLIDVEAFIRQLIGWRSYVRFIYIYHGEEMMKMNNLNHKNNLDISWYDGKTDIPIINDMILKVKKYAYLHHIERLMIIGNYSLISLINPLEIYKWFMICFIDSYEWVMVANVFGMSQYSLNPSSLTMMSRPYFSSTNYIFKMSDYKNDKKEWIDKWNKIYWSFVNIHKNILSKIYSTAILVKYLKNKNKLHIS